MITEENAKISLCRFSYVNPKGDVWLERLADVCMESGKPCLKKFKGKAVGSQNRSEGEDRESIYGTGAKIEKGQIGVWKWWERDNYNQPGKIQSVSEILEDDNKYNAIEICEIPEASDIYDMLECLEKGIQIPSLLSRTVLFRYRAALEGILIRIDCFTQAGGGKVKLDENNERTFMRCGFTLADIFSFQEKSFGERKVIFRCDLQDKGKILSLSINSFLRKRIMRQMKENKVDVEKNRKFFEQFLRQIAEPDLAEELAKRYGMAENRASQMVYRYVERGQVRLSGNDVDGKVLIRFVERNEVLKKQAVAEWTRQNLEALEQKKSKLEDEIRGLLQKKGEVEMERDDAETSKRKAIEETKSLRITIDKLNRKKEEIEEEIKKKLNQMREDAAGFITEWTLFAPSSEKSMGTRAVSETNGWRFIPGTTVTGEAEDCINTEILEENLEDAGVGETWRKELAAFFAAAYLKKFPLLLAGPQAGALADAVAVSVVGKRAAHLSCCGAFSRDALTKARKEEILAVENPFHPDWLSALVESGSTEKTWQLWLTPFTEDLTMEPQSLYQYVWPVLTECFVEMECFSKKKSEGDFFPGILAAENQKTEKCGLRLPKSGKFLEMRLREVLSLAEAFGGKREELEFLLGYLPWRVVRGETASLEEDSKVYAGLSKEAKKLLERYEE